MLMHELSNARKALTIKYVRNRRAQDWWNTQLVNLRWRQNNSPWSFEFEIPVCLHISIYINFQWLKLGEGQPWWRGGAGWGTWMYAMGIPSDSTHRVHCCQSLGSTSNRWHLIPHTRFQAAWLPVHAVINTTPMIVKKLFVRRTSNRCKQLCRIHYAARNLMSSRHHWKLHYCQWQVI